jgi:adrenodoxin-NADP+ reductase
MSLQGVGFHSVTASLMPTDLKSLPRVRRRLMEVIAKGSATQVVAAEKSWSLDFCLSPTEFVSKGNHSGFVESTLFERMKLDSKLDPKSTASPTGESINIPSQLVFRSIGYKSIALPGFKDAGIIFDERSGVIKNDGLGRVFGEKLDNQADETWDLLPGMYCAGWVKTGPTGVIASTMADAFTTADVIVQDWLSQMPFLGNEEPDYGKAGWNNVRRNASLAGKIVTWKDWHAIDKVELERGKNLGKSREKFTSTSEMLKVLG